MDNCESVPGIDRFFRASCPGITTPTPRTFTDAAGKGGQGASPASMTARKAAFRVADIPASTSFYPLRCRREAFPGSVRRAAGRSGAETRQHV